MSNVLPYKCKIMSSCQTACVFQVLTDVLIPATMQDMPERFDPFLAINNNN